MQSIHALSDAALAAHIVERFHEAHRRDLPRVVALAAALAGEPVGIALHERVRRMAADLEAHMFKEEMRLLPMIEQGGGALVGHLVDDMVAEHRVHDAAIADVEVLFAALPPTDAGQAVRRTLRFALDVLFADLAEHVRLEDDVLFARFAGAPRGPMVG